MQESTNNGNRYLTLCMTGLLVVFSLVATWPVWSDIFTIGTRDEENSHVMLVPFVCLWLVWSGRHRMYNWKNYGWWTGLVFALSAATCAYVGSRYRVLALWHLSGVLCLLAAVVAGFGVNVLRRFSHVCLISLFVVPIPGIIRRQISLPLQFQSANLTQKLLGLFGIQVEQTGHLLSIDGTLVTIAEACNGMRMLTSLLLVLYAIAFSSRMGNKSRLLLFLLSPLLVLAVNIVRLASTVFLYGSVTPEIASQFHDVSGWAIPVVLMLAALFNTVPSTPRAPTSDDSPRVPKRRQYLVTATCMAVFVLLWADNRRGLASQSMLAKHHDGIVNSVMHFPYAVDDWMVIEEEELHAEEVQLLNPIASFRRVYRNVETDQELRLTIIHSPHARDLIGHEPSICFVGQGWQLDESQMTSWQHEASDVSGRSFLFSRDNMPNLRAHCVIITPTGSTTGDMADLADAASDHRLEPFGATEVQLTSTAWLTDEQWHTIGQDFTAAMLNCLRAYGPARQFAVDKAHWQD